MNFLRHTHSYWTSFCQECELFNRFKRSHSAILLKAFILTAIWYFSFFKHIFTKQNHILKIRIYYINNNKWSNKDLYSAKSAWAILHHKWLTSDCRCSPHKGPKQLDLTTDFGCIDWLIETDNDHPSALSPMLLLINLFLASFPLSRRGKIH